MQEKGSYVGRIEYKWLAMVAVSIGTFMATVDSSIVNVSLPVIMASLRTNLPTIQWVVAIYLLVITGLLLTLGRLADLAGRKLVLVWGYAVFTIGSLLCGLSRSPFLLIASRGIQAVGAAMIMANGPAVITDAFPIGERGKALGMFAMVVASGLTIGPVLGGFIVEAAGWPWIFFVNLPIGVFGMIFVQRVLKCEQLRLEQNFDIFGAALFLVSLVSLTMALSQGPQKGWNSNEIVALLITCVVFGALFILHEKRTPHSILTLTLFRQRLFAAACASAFINFSSTFSVAFLMPFYLSQVLGYEPRRMGLTLTATPITVALVAPLSGNLSDRIGSRVLGSIGLGLASIGLVLIGCLGASPSHIRVVIALVVVGLGTAIFQSPNNNALMSSVPKGMLGVAGGMLATMRNLGMVTGVAISQAVYSSRLMYYQTRLDDVAARVNAFRDAFLVAAIICTIGVITSAVKGQERMNSDACRIA
ncbi:MAG: MFS transporter [Armatimonadota bacterium]|nr:MFS transporter [Armatimonadota bacterium]